MPREWPEPTIFLEHNDVKVYHVPKDTITFMTFRYTTNPYPNRIEELYSDSGTCQFDVRDLEPLNDLNAYLVWEADIGAMKAVIQHHIDKGGIRNCEPVTLED